MSFSKQPRSLFHHLSQNKEVRDTLVALATFVQLFFVIGIFVCILVVSVYTVSLGLGLKVYVTAADLTPERVAKVVNQTFDIISNVDEISSNAVPVSLEAKNVMVNGTNATIVSDTISRTYESFSALHKSDWKNLVTNFTLPGVTKCSRSRRQCTSKPDLRKYPDELTHSTLRGTSLTCRSLQ